MTLRTDKKIIVASLTIMVASMTMSNAYASHPLPTFYPFNSANKQVCYQISQLNAVKLNGQTNQGTALKNEIEISRQHIDSQTDINIAFDSVCNSGDNQVGATVYASYVHAQTVVFNSNNPSTMYKIIYYNSSSSKNFSTTSTCGLFQDPNPTLVGNHEFGHFAGLNHAPSSDPTGHTMMKPDCSWDYASIKTADINQINGLY